jgi:hypothetical protein
VGLHPPRSDRLSTGMDRTSCGKDVSGSIDISIVMDATFRAVPRAFIKRKGFKDMTTVKAAFGRGVPLVNFDESTPVPHRFVFQLPHELAPSHIGDGFGEAVVVDHVLDGQAFDAYDLVLAYDLGRELVLIVTASVGNTSVYSGNPTTRLVSILGAFALPGLRALRLCQFLLIFGKEARVAERAPLGGDDHRLQAQIQPNHVGCHGQRRDLFFDEQRDKVATCTVLGNGDGRRRTRVRQGARPPDIQRGIHLCQREVGSIPLESRGGVFCRLNTVLLVEGGIVGTPFKEGAKRLIQVPQRLLRRNRGNLIQPDGFGLLFEDGKRRGGLMVADALLMLIIGIGPQAQRPIIDVAYTTKRPSQHLLLFVGGVASVLVRSFLFHISHASISYVKSQAGGTACGQPFFPPLVETVGFPERTFL